MAQGTTRGIPIDTDVTLSANSDILVASQKAVKTYADTKISSVIGTSPIVSSGGTTPSISIPQANGSADGYLSSTDWTTFNNKQNVLTNPVTGTGTNNQIAVFNSTGSTITSLNTSTYPTLTELSYVKGVTSSIQTQLDSKGVGNMVLASAQTNSGAKTFLDTSLLLRNVANTFNGSFTNTNTADRIYTLPNATGTIALTSDLSSYVPYSGASGNINIGANSYLGTKIQLGTPTLNSFGTYGISVKVASAEGLYIEGTASNAKILLQAVGMTGGNGQVELTTGLNNNGFLRLGLTYLRESGGLLTVSATNFAPTATLHVRSANATAGNNILLIQNSAPTTLFQVTADSKIGFFGATAVVKQTLGAGTAASTYGTNEQGMLQRVYDAIRNYGLGT